MLYAKAESKIASAAKRKKSSKANLALLAKFGKEFPPTLIRVMAGETAEGMGFHQIALQIAITANALGKDEDTTIALCEGLIANHVSDGNRYNTPAKRTEELRRLLRYTVDNPCYEYSRDALKKVVAGTAGELKFKA